CCHPDTCGGKGYQCGMPSDGCLSTLSCGNCQPADDPSTCKRDGNCTAGLLCELWSASTPCAAPACVDGATMSSATPVRYCDGFGTCAPGNAASCGHYKCDPSTNACRTSCTNDGDCVQGYACSSASTCLRANGAGCQNASQCASGFCVDF